jgi:DNA-binding transcriptional regulator/RsmH inhibitor MraZ
MKDVHENLSEEIRKQFNKTLVLGDLSEILSSNNNELFEELAKDLKKNTAFKDSSVELLKSLLHKEIQKMHAIEKGSIKKENHNEEKHWVSVYSSTKGVKLTVKNAKNLIVLINMIGLNTDGVLMKNKKEYAKLEDVAERIGCTKDQARRILNNFDGSVLDLEKDDKNTIIKITMKPEYHEKGDQTKKESWAKVYQKSVQDKYEKEIKSGNTGIEFGLLYKLIPYVHYKTAHVCRYPDYDQLDEIEPLNNKKIAETLGLDEDTVSRYMRKLYEHGIVLPIGSKNDVHYLVHPHYVFRRPIVYAEQVLANFEVAKGLQKQKAKKRGTRGAKKKVAKQG